MRPGRPKGLLGISVLLTFVVAAGPLPTSAVEVHDIATVTPPGSEVKCGCSTCGNPCNVQPPPLPSPPPPPPSPPPPPKSPSLYCPPPPVPAFNFLGPPGDLYPVDSGYPWPSAASRRSSAPVGLPDLLGCGLLGLLGYWWL